MTLNDPIANMLSKITNAERLKKSDVSVSYNNKIIQKVLQIMNEEQYVGENKLEDKDLHITLLGRVNKTNVIKPRFAVKIGEYDKWEKRYLPAKDFGFLIVSTNKGLMTHKKAKEQKLGGKLIAYCY
jgi:small subunit ribosomal protein S8